MKTFLKKMLFWDSPVQGAFFALTLLGLGPYIIMSILTKYSLDFYLSSCSMLLNDPFAAAAFWILAVTPWIFLVYYMFLTFHFYHKMSCSSGSDFHKYILRFGLPALMLINGWPCLVGDYSSDWMTACFLGFFFALLPLLFCGRHWKIALGSVLCWAVWTMMLTSLFFSISATAKTGREEKLAAFWSSLFSLPCHWFGCSLSVWIVLWISVIPLFFLAWYLFSAKLFSAWEGIPLRVLFGKPTIVLLILFAEVFWISCFLVLTSGYCLNHRIKLAETHFGHPLTLKALEKVYNGQDRPDAKYWSRVYKLSRKCVVDLPETPSRVSEPFRYLPETDVVHVWKRLGKVDKNLIPLEELFSGMVPPQKRAYAAEEVKYSWSYLESHRIYCNLEFWRFQVTLANGSSPAAALSVWARMESIHEAMLRECEIDGGLLWLNCGDLILSGVKILLESGKLSDADLGRLEGTLGKIENQLPSFYNRCLYGSLVLFLERSSNPSFEMTCRNKGETRNESIPLKPLRFFFPQIWALILIHISDSVEAYTKTDFNYYLLKKQFFHDYVNIAPQNFSIMFTRFIAELRSVQVLVRAERYKLEHGRYPDRMKNLPLDPYNGKPLNYRVGNCRVINTTVYWHLDPEYPTKAFSRKEPDRETVIPAVQVWSVGMDQKDDGGLPTGGNDKRNDYSDDIHVIRRLKK